MGMLKGNSSSLNFDQLMAQATQVAKQQDAALMERARQKLREEEDRRRREARAAREKEAAEKERRLQMQQQQQQKKKASMVQTKRSSKTSEGMERKKSVTATTKGRNVNSSKRFPAASQPASSFFPEKKKQVDMSFEELMRTAKEQSMNKASSSFSVEKSTPSKSRSVDKPRESLYHKQPQRKPAFTPPSSSDHQLSARERAKLMGAEVPKRVMNSAKKDKRSISEIQREIRHSKGIHSDEEDNVSSRKDSRLMSNKNNRQAQRYQYNTSPLPRKRQLSPPLRQSQAPVKRSSIPPPSQSRVMPPAGPRRMPFSGRPLDGRRNGPSEQAIMNRRRYREEEEEDEEMDDFVVDDEDDDDGFDDRYSRNNYSDEISKMFRYDKSRYANEPAFSDDDMEANASDVLREEKRSERIARREDLIEEQKELERLQKKKKRS